MNSEIFRLTVINQMGTEQYQVGETYNGLLLDSIVDVTVSGDDAHIPHYEGRTAGKSPVFETISAPIAIDYRAKQGSK